MERSIGHVCRSALLSSPMRILGIHTGHTATAAYLRDGEITHCISEERFSRVKNGEGYPGRAIDQILQEEGITSDELDVVVVCGLHPTASLYEAEGLSRSKSIQKFKYQVMWWEQYSPFLRRMGDSYVRHFGFQKRVEPQRQFVDRQLAQRLGVRVDKIQRFDHHFCHVATAYYGLCDQTKEWLIVTVDGGGDEVSATVSIGRGRSIETVARTPVSSSLGVLYSAVTDYLGMKPLEHEYKVMGLAPYAHPEMVARSLKVLKRLIWLDEESLQWRSCVRNPVYYRFLKTYLERHRFDQVAGAAQQLTEELLCALVISSIKKTGIRNVAVAGGVFLNVKANLRLAQLPDVEEFVVFPSPGDESLPIGGAFLAYVAQTNMLPKKITTLYLGPSYTENRVKEALVKGRCFERYDIKEYDEPEREVARLLAANQIVARFAGRMEWGARALGNRSILAHPANRDNVRVINEQIKGRDFWMPFAPSILKERATSYLVNPKGVPAPYMIVSFKTTPQGRDVLGAAIHPYDFTVRPQVVEQSFNPSYWKLIQEFERLTGIGAVLNTSFNLHGDPIVCTPDDALYTFEHSGLHHLNLERFILTKRHHGT